MLDSSSLTPLPVIPSAAREPWGIPWAGGARPGSLAALGTIAEASVPREMHTQRAGRPRSCRC
ncbi:MAG: hypothetical protein ACRDI2_12220, partial [Chloroflexota bacterium]